MSGNNLMRLRLFINVLPLWAVILSLTACYEAPSFKVAGESQSSISIRAMLYVDTPYEVIDKREKQRDHYWNDAPLKWDPFYLWIKKAIMLLTDVVVMDDKEVVVQARANGLRPIVRYYEENPRKEIAHLSFHDTDIPKLCRLAKELGAIYLIKARLTNNRSKYHRGGSARRTTTVLGVRIKALFPTFATTTRSTSVEFTVYDVRNYGIVLTKELTSEHEAGPILVDYKVQRSLARGLVSNILVAGVSHSGERASTFATSQINSTKTLEFDVRWVGHRKYYKERHLTLNSIKRMNSDLLEVNLSFRDYHDEDLSLSLRHLSNGSIAAYLVDENGLRYYASSSNLQGDRTPIRPEERKDIRLTVNGVPSIVETADFYIEFDVRTPRRNNSFNLKFQNIEVP